MKKPYRFLVDASTYPVIAEQHDDGSWTFEAPFGSLTKSDEYFTQWYTPMSEENYETQPGGKPFKLDIDKALEQGTHTVKLLASRESIQSNHNENPNAWYLTATRVAYQYSDFPIGWSSTYWEGQEPQLEEVWPTPLVALNPTQ
ncbi:hypothetical protein [Corynebacterium marquesiae]|uniref:hypothetical protein n=1 Tax=Corynebacterium marquesiae TaxID=2913503 RepID=UPI0038D2501E